MRYHTTTRPIIDIDGNQTGFEQVNIPFTPEEELEADLMEAASIREYPYKLMKEQIASLEAQVTPRRQREAI